jgi:hypothetical protein
MSAVDDLRDAAPPSLRSELLVLTAGAALLAAGYWAERRYRQWGKEASPFAGPRARATSIRSSIRRKRTGFADATQTIVEFVGDLENLHPRP